MWVLLNHFLYGLTAPVVLNLLIIKVYRLHSDITHLVGLLWKSERPAAETSDSTQHSMRDRCHRQNSNRQSQP